MSQISLKSTKYRTYNELFLSKNDINLHICKDNLQKQKFICIFARLNFLFAMIIDNKVILDDFVQKHAKAIKPLNKWVEEVTKANWQRHNDLKGCFPTADYIGNGRYVFNIGGNNFRIVAVVVFIAGIMSLRFVGTHAQYDNIKDCSVI